MFYLLLYSTYRILLFGLKIYLYRIVSISCICICASKLVSSGIETMKVLEVYGTAFSQFRYTPAGTKRDSKPCLQVTLHLLKPCLQRKLLFNNLRLLLNRLELGYMYSGIKRALTVACKSKQIYFPPITL